MKRIIGVVLVLALLLMVGCAPEAVSEQAAASDNAATTEAAEEVVAEGGTPQPAAEVAEQGYDFYDKAVSYSDLDLGPIPKPEGAVTLGFVCKAFDNEFWAANKEGALAAAEELKAAGIDITYDVRAAQGEGDDVGQLAVMNDMVNKGYDGIVLSPIAEGNLLPGVEKAIAKGIPMVVNNDAFMPEIDVTAGVWHWEGGLLAAEYINDLLGGSGKVVIIQGNLKTPPARSRTDAFVQWFEENNPNVEILDIQQADWDRLKAKDITDTWLKKYRILMQFSVIMIQWLWELLKRLNLLKKTSSLLVSTAQAKHVNQSRLAN